MCKMRKLCMLLLLATITHCQEDCRDVLFFTRQSRCAHERIVRVPSDGSGTYHLMLNASIPIYTNKNIGVYLENEREVSAGVADYLTYVVWHPSCGVTPYVTMLRTNEYTCWSALPEAYRQGPVTHLYHESTIHGKSYHHPPASLLSSVDEERDRFIDFANRQLQAFRSSSHFSSSGTHFGGGGGGVGSSSSSGFTRFSEFSSIGGGFGDDEDDDGFIPQRFNIGGSNRFTGIGAGPEPPLSSTSSARPAPDTGSRSSDKAYLNTRNVCGKGASATTLIINGIAASAEEFPWLGGLFAVLPSGDEYRCTVNLVTRKHLLSAAHCFPDGGTNPDNYHVLLGHQTSKPHRITRLQRIDVHPLYSSDSHKKPHDVAVLTMRNEVRFSDKLHPICLWQQLGDRGRDNEPVMGTVAGFAPTYFDSFNKVEFPMVSNEKCLASNDGYRDVLSDSNFCAGTRNNSGPCVGDSGAGFMQHIQGRYYIRGLVSKSLVKSGSKTYCDLENYIIFADLTAETGFLHSMLS